MPANAEKPFDQIPHTFLKNSVKSELMGVP